MTYQQEKILHDPRELHSVKASKIKFNFIIFIFQQFLFKIFLSLAYLISSVTIICWLLFFIVCELLLANYFNVKFAEAKTALPIENILLSITTVLFFINGIFFLIRLYKNTPIDIFNSFSLEQIFYKKSFNSDYFSEIKNKIIRLIIGFFQFFLATPGQLAANSLGIFCQSFKILFKMPKYSNLIIILTQATTPIDEDVAFAFADIDGEKGKKHLDKLVESGWVIKIRNGYKLSTIYREKFDKNFHRETL